MLYICICETKLIVCACVLGTPRGSNWNILQQDGRTDQDKSSVMQHSGEMCIGGNCGCLSGMVLISGE